MRNNADPRRSNNLFLFLLISAYGRILCNWVESTPCDTPGASSINQYCLVYSRLILCVDICIYATWTKIEGLAIIWKINQHHFSASSKKAISARVFAGAHPSEQGNLTWDTIKCFITLGEEVLKSIQCIGERSPPSKPHELGRAFSAYLQNIHNFVQPIRQL